MRFYDPLNDAAFKKVFGSEENKDITISFLNAILELEGQTAIEEIDFLNVESQPLTPDGNRGIFDVYCRRKNGERIIIEMQKNIAADFDKRMVFYGAKVYIEQLKRAARYRTLCPVTVVAVVNFDLFPQKKAFKTLYGTCDLKTGEPAFGQLNYAVVELKKFSKREDELITNEDKWLFFLKEIIDKETVPAALQEAEFAKACYRLEQDAWSSAERNEYEKASLDEENEEARMVAAKDAKAREIATRLLASGMKVGEIAQVTGLSESDIQDLKK